MPFSRFAIYDLPAGTEWAQRGASWLGWDAQCARACQHPSLPGLDDVTMMPRKYGFHGTLKAPFRLAAGIALDDLQDAVATLALRTAPARCDGLELAKIGRFLALIPRGDASDIAKLAARCVTSLDPFRATTTDAELARRRAAGLTPAQETLLMQWGYPYVLGEFRFHITLTGALEPEALERWHAQAESWLPPPPSPYQIASLALAGERVDGRFELIQRYALAG